MLEFSFFFFAAIIILFLISLPSRYDPWTLKQKLMFVITVLLLCSIFFLILLVNWNKYSLTLINIVHSKIAGKLLNFKTRVYAD